MSFHHPLRQTKPTDYSPTRSSPLRQPSNASTNSSAYSNYSNPFTPSRSSTISSAASSGYQYTAAGHKRGISEASGMGSSAGPADSAGSSNTGPAGAYRSTRQSLRPLPQPPGASPPPIHKAIYTGHSRGQSAAKSTVYNYDGPAYSPSPTSSQENRPHSVALSRADSITPSSSTSPRPHMHHAHTTNPLASAMSPPDLQTLKNSSTSHLRTLSKFAQNGESDEFSLSSPAPSVVGLQGRRQLKRTDSTRHSKGTVALGNGSGSAWGERNWMDKQRQYLQAYEYLCHIGEAKEWIEDIIHKPVPPIVQLEEALRDGVTLAEVVQALYPDRPVRIFRHPKLQFRHSDNIALFFRFLADVDLPELFRFELIDLYEKKNIPKVIYCIHALSWLLYRKGVVDFRIGNLVGQLEFEHHELEETQKGLDRAGISMPSFSGMGATFGAEPEPEPAPEPVESEEDRIARELARNETMILDLQAQMRGALVRLQLGQKMQGLWDKEEALVELQSRIRGDWARQIVDYRLSMKRFAVNLQSAARGYSVRARELRNQQWWGEREDQVVLLQSLARAKKCRGEVQRLKAHVKQEASCIPHFQAAIRGALQRKYIDDQFEAGRATGADVANLQAAARGMIERRRIQSVNASLRLSQNTITSLEAMIRGRLIRTRLNQQEQALQSMTGMWRALQAVSRGSSLRAHTEELQDQLQTHQETVKTIQAFARGSVVRQYTQRVKGELSPLEGAILGLQSSIRGNLLRARLATDLRALESQHLQVTSLQAHVRAYLRRQGRNRLQSDLVACMSEVMGLQSLSRAMQVRVQVGVLLNQFEAEEYIISELQATIRGKMVRERFVEKQRYYKENMEKVVKVQSFIRARLQGEAYKTLTSGKNPPVGTVKGFVHLLNDSDFDFKEEVEFERLRKTVVQHVRQNEMADQYITQLDIKIALLVKNKITLDEVVKHQKHFGGHVGSLLTNTEMASKDPFDLKALNKNSRRKLEHYQELFFILQTQPQYLARLFRKIREQATAEKECDRIKHLTMGVFGYAQKRREEYYLLKLITRSIKEEVDACPSIQDYLRGNFFWAKVFSAYVKSPRDRKYMRDVLGPIVKENIIKNSKLDLESDPMQIYLSAIENEQLRTGQRSHRRPNVSREEAIRDPETKNTFIAHLSDLRDIADEFFAALEDHLHKLPYGVRYIAQQMFQCLTSKFQHEEQGHMLQIVGHWAWKSYLQPALLEPEKHGVVDRGLSQEHKRNLAQVTKVLGQVAAGRLFGGENVFLQPLNSYVGESIERVGEIWANVITIPDAETQFDIDEFNDLYARTKPTLYIKMADIFSIHHLVAADIPYICPSQDDILREVIRELGSVKNNENELMNVSTSEISLTLNPKLRNVEDPEAEVKALFMETKRCILYIIRVQSGANLMEIMVKPITMEDEDKWDGLVRDELSAGSRKRGAYAEANTLIDIASMAYAELKRTALENILRLEQLGRLTRHNHYQDLLNAIAVDIRTKHRRRVQRQRELEGVRLTLARLNDQAVYLDQQLKTYNDYIEQAMVTLQNKKGKKRFLMPFTKQWDHERELQRSGRVPKFGSFKYSAQDLANRGVLVSWQGYNERQWDRIDLTISSNEVGVFSIEGSNGPIAMPGASAHVPLDDLLQAQFNGTQFLEFFGGQLRVNVNLFLHLIMRKFYKDKDS
ncbi:MAG: IQ domain-containing containing GTPase activating [Lasallia pustulata]|uniref:IQ domain-containing containing GTPase activating n=1 Tax=Lasallia pustulata TaxID=136370 RepID=A0A5M8Q4R1_9LECA|nr:MAG: IQ domain-containing containing GTPase activating [Lasallia pustulata]